MEVRQGSGTKARLPWLVRGIIVLLLIAQAILVVRETLGPWFSRIVAHRDLTSFERSAVFNLNDYGAAYVRFVNSLVEPTGEILLPAKRHHAPFTFTKKRSMLFFFLPRTLHECNAPSIDPCAARLASDDVAVLSISDFPPQGSVPTEKVHVQFREQGPYDGIYVAQQVGPTSAEPAILTVAGRVWEVIGTGLLVLAFAAIGAQFTVLVLAEASLIDILALSLPLGLGSATFLAFLASWIGISLSRVTLLVILSAMNTGFAILLVIRGELRGKLRSIWKEISSIQGREAPRLFAWAIVVSILLVYAAIAVGKSYTYTDPIQNWALKGYAISEFETILVAEEWGTPGLEYPLNLSLGVTFFRSLVGDLGPGAKVLPALLTISLLLGLESFWRTEDISSFDRILGGFVIALHPLVAIHSISMLANLPTAVYLGLGLTFTVRGAVKDRRGSSILGGILLAWGGWTRVEALPYALIAGVFVWGYQAIKGLRISTFMWWLGSLLPFSIMWQIFSIPYSRGTYVQGAPTSFISAVKETGLILEPVRMIVRAFWEEVAAWPLPADSWAGYMIVVALLVMVGLVGIRRSHPAGELHVLVAFVAVLLCTIGVFYMWSYSRPDIERIVRGGIHRALLPAAVLLVAWALPFAACMPENSSEP